MSEERPAHALQPSPPVFRVDGAEHFASRPRPARPPTPEEDALDQVMARYPEAGWVGGLERPVRVDSWEVEPEATEYAGARLSDLPDHLKAYHGWTDEDVAQQDGRLRRAHFHEHVGGEQDHLTTDWSC